MKNNSKLVIIIGLFAIVCFWGIFASYKAHQFYEQTKQEPETIVEYVYIEQEPEIITETIYLPSTDEFYRSFTDEDVWYLKDIAMREAGNQGVIGQCWVMYTVLCRAEAYNMSIKDVCESKAFESSRGMSGKTPNDDCNEALALIEAGWIPKPLWFRRDHYHNFGNPLCKVGDHYFSAK